MDTDHYYKDEVINLISRGHVHEAVKALLSHSNPSAIAISGRYNRLKQDIRNGIISYENSSQEQSRIVQSILSSIGADIDTGLGTDIVPGITNAVGGDKTKALLDRLQLIREYTIRRNPQLSNEAYALIGEIRAYNDEKRVNPLYDPTNRRMTLFENRVLGLESSSQISNENKYEEFVGKISPLLSDTVPSYENLKEAYSLACGRGFISSHIERQLEAMPDDDEVRISIAEQIEHFVAINKRQQ